MTYLFEDRKDSCLSQFYLTAFNPGCLVKFEFSGGKDKLVKKASDLLKSGQTIYTFMDLIEDNKDTVDVFHDLWERHLYRPDKLIVIPLVCSEYYLLKSVENTPLVSNRYIINTCLHSPCHLVDTQWVNGRTKQTSFENYCKHAVKYGLLDCFRINDNRGRKRFYYEQDCLCSNPKSKDKCFKCSKLEKALSYLREYPMFPLGSMLKNLRNVDREFYMKYLIDRIAYHNNRVTNYIRYLQATGGQKVQIEQLKDCFITTNSAGIPI